MNNLEALEQQKLIQYLKIKNYFVFSITNENNHSFLNKHIALRIEAKNKKMGKVKGTPDLIVFCKNNNKTLFIEMKKQKKILKNGNKSKVNLASKEQLDFVNEINNNDKYKNNVRIARICYGFDEALDFIKKEDI